MENDSVEAMIEQLQSDLETATEQYRNKEYTEAELQQIAEVICEGMGDNPEELLSNPNRLLDYTERLSELTLKDWKRKSLYSSFQLAPRIAKLSFEDYLDYRNQEEKLVIKHSSELANTMQERVMPYIFPKLMESFGGLFGGLMGGGDGFLSGLDDWKKEQDGQSGMADIFEQLGFVNPFQQKPTDGDSEDED